MAHHVAARRLDRGHPAVRREAGGRGETPDVADPAEDLRGEDRADPEQAGERRPRLRDRLGDAGLERRDLGIEASRLTDEIAGQQTSRPSRAGGRSATTQQGGRGGGGEMRRHGAGDQVCEQGVQAIEHLGASGDQVVAAIRQQTERRRVALKHRGIQLGGAAGGQRGADGVGRIRLPAVSGREHPNPGGQLRRHVDDRLAVTEEPLGHGAAESAHVFDRPPTLRPGACPATQLAVAGRGGEHSDLPDHLLSTI